MGTSWEPQIKVKTDSDGFWSLEGFLTPI